MKRYILLPVTMSWVLQYGYCIAAWTSFMCWQTNRKSIKFQDHQWPTEVIIHRGFSCWIIIQTSLSIVSYSKKYKTAYAKYYDLFACIYYGYMLIQNNSNKSSLLLRWPGIGCRQLLHTLKSHSKIKKHISEWCYEQKMALFMLTTLTLH